MGVDGWPGAGVLLACLLACSLARLVARAESAGYEALVLTVDAPVLGRREADVRNRFGLPSHVTLENFTGLGAGAMGQASDDSVGRKASKPGGASRQQEQQLVAD